MDSILILDFGSQTTQLIARRVRELGVYTEILPGDEPLAGHIQPHVRGIILSGSPMSVLDQDSTRPDQLLYNTGIPVLGICYGLQRMTHDNGGTVAPAASREFGRSRLCFSRPHPLFAKVTDAFVGWMSHGDSILEPAPGGEVILRSENGLVACVDYPDRGMTGIQFHPEVTHCEYGTQILGNFVFGICGATGGWSMEEYRSQAAAQIQAQVGAEPVLLLISGGVDSSVAAALLLEALPAEQVYLMYIDTGMMRAGETKQVAAVLSELGAEHLFVVDAAERFLTALAGQADPEEKRRIIGDMFIEVQEQEVRTHVPGNYFLAQGTLYTDLIESGKGVGKNAKVIKSHHNVRSPLVEKKRAEGRIVEPLAALYKDEVRALGRALGLPESTVGRHPFPGPGLAVRILGELTAERCDLLRRADAIYIEELRARGLYDQIWQAFAVLLPVRAVGVAGDAREYGSVLALRAVVSHDGMTADVFAFPPQDLLEISARITNQVAEIGRVVYDVSSKPPATIEWE